ncbi:procollagen C-endopeptidase enhancer 1 [Rhineura floridana]|uniref:procollagen C-endopeptidase enhancer 1 n=1 Tax=Rhineura floridana TaxID=261503 RepID=UPI002AC84B0E|nr:procollagen C-endopeptidase enhancer 1 [Rhineura floridana]
MLTALHAGASLPSPSRQQHRREDGRTDHGPLPASAELERGGRPDEQRRASLRPSAGKGPPLLLLLLPLRAAVAGGLPGGWEADPPGGGAREIGAVCTCSTACRRLPAFGAPGLAVPLSALPFGNSAPPGPPPGCLEAGGRWEVFRQFVPRRPAAWPSVPSRLFRLQLREAPRSVRMAPGCCLLPALLLSLLQLTRAQNPAAAPTHNQSRPVFLCGGDYTGETGYIASEGFPSHYPPSKTCTWSITVPEGQVVMLSFRVFDLEPDPICRYDYLDVYNGHSAMEGQRLGRFCGTFRPGAILSTSNRMMLQMVSDEGTGGRGFLVWFNGGLPHVNEHQFCGGKLEKPQGTLKTPNWPESDYPPGVSCSWHIVAPKDKVIALTFGKFDVEPDTYCRYDYVAVFNGGDRDDSRRVGKFCGDESPSPVYSDGNELLVQFVSDLSVTADGFSASYVVKNPNLLLDKAVSQPGGRVFPGSKPAQPDRKPLPPKVKPASNPAAPAKPAPGPKPNPKPRPSGTEPTATDPDEVSCPQQCRRTGTLQSNFCSSDFVITGTVKTAVRGAGNRVTATLTLTNTYKAGALSLPAAGNGATLRLEVPCRQCPILKKGASYVFMGKVGADGAGQLTPNSFVVPFRQQQHQILTNFSKRPCAPPATRNRT